MPKRMIVLIVVVVLSVACLTLRPTPLYGQDKPVPRDDKELVRDLDDELSAIEEEDTPLEEDEVKAQILEALHANKDIDFDALEAELEADGSSIEDVLDCAVNQAEGLSCQESQASGRQPNNWRLVLVSAPPQGKAARTVVPSKVASNFEKSVVYHHDRVKARTAP